MRSRGPFGRQAAATLVVSLLSDNICGVSGLSFRSFSEIAARDGTCPTHCTPEDVRLCNNVDKDGHWVSKGYTRTVDKKTTTVNKCVTEKVCDVQVNEVHQKGCVKQTEHDSIDDTTVNNLCISNVKAQGFYAPVQRSDHDSTKAPFFSIPTRGLLAQDAKTKTHVRYGVQGTAGATVNKTCGTGKHQKDYKQHATPTFQHLGGVTQGKGDFPAVQEHFNDLSLDKGTQKCAQKCTDFREECKKQALSSTTCDCVGFAYSVKNNCQLFGTDAKTAPTAPARHGWSYFEYKGGDLQGHATAEACSGHGNKDHDTYKICVRKTRTTHTTCPRDVKVTVACPKEKWTDPRKGNSDETTSQQKKDEAQQLLTQFQTMKGTFSSKKATVTTIVQHYATAKRISERWAAWAKKFREASARNASQSLAYRHAKNQAKEQREVDEAKIKSLAASLSALEKQQKKTKKAATQDKKTEAEEKVKEEAEKKKASAEEAALEQAEKELAELTDKTDKESIEKRKFWARRKNLLLLQRENAKKEAEQDAWKKQNLKWANSKKAREDTYAAKAQSERVNLQKTKTDFIGALNTALEKFYQAELLRCDARLDRTTSSCSQQATREKQKQREELESAYPTLTTAVDDMLAHGKNKPGLTPAETVVKPENNYAAGGTPSLSDWHKTETKNTFEGTKSYDDIKQVCTAAHKQMCGFKDLCASGQGSAPVTAVTNYIHARSGGRRDDVWVPVGAQGSGNMEWVRVAGTMDKKGQPAEANTEICRTYQSYYGEGAGRPVRAAGTNDSDDKGDPGESATWGSHPKTHSSGIKYTFAACCTTPAPVPAPVPAAHVDSRRRTATPAPLVQAKEGNRAAAAHAAAAAPTTVSNVQAKESSTVAEANKEMGAAVAKEKETAAAKEGEDRNKVTEAAEANKQDEEPREAENSSEGSTAAETQARTAKQSSGSGSRGERRSGEGSDVSQREERKGSRDSENSDSERRSRSRNSRDDRDSDSDSERRSRSRNSRDSDSDESDSEEDQSRRSRRSMSEESRANRDGESDSEGRRESRRDGRRD